MFVNSKEKRAEIFLLLTAKYDVVVGFSESRDTDLWIGDHHSRVATELLSLRLHVAERTGNLKGDDQCERGDAVYGKSAWEDSVRRLECDALKDCRLSCLSDGKTCHRECVNVCGVFTCRFSLLLLRFAASRAQVCDLRRDLRLGCRR